MVDLVRGPPANGTIGREEADRCQHWVPKRFAWRLPEIGTSSNKAEEVPIFLSTPPKSYSIAFNGINLLPTT